jgi:predicted RNA-binding Zn-ribbon protein involved in translation (DUF1610 family)
MSYVKNQLIQCRECGYEITPGEGILLYKDPKTGDEDWVCCMTCNMGFAGVDYADVHPARYEYDGNEPIHDDNVDNPGARIGE